MIICEKLTYLRMLTFGIPASKSAPKRKEHIDNQKEVLWTEEQEPDVARNGWSWGWGWPNGGGQKAKPTPTLWQGQTGHSVPWPSGAEKTPNPPVWQHGKGISFNTSLVCIVKSWLALAVTFARWCSKMAWMVAHNISFFILFDCIVSRICLVCFRIEILTRRVEYFRAP